MQWVSYANLVTISLTLLPRAPRYANSESRHKNRYRMANSHASFCFDLLLIATLDVSLVQAESYFQQVCALDSGCLRAAAR